MGTYETEQLLTTIIHIPSKDIYRTKSIDGLILLKLRGIIEGNCGKSGYVIPDSTHIVQRSIGTILTLDGKNEIEYHLTYKVKTINPKKHDIYECVIDSITKMGLIAYLHGKYDIKTSPILFIIPQDYLKDRAITDFEMDQVIQVKILEVRVKHQSTQIQAVAELSE